MIFLPLVDTCSFQKHTYDQVYAKNRRGQHNENSNRIAFANGVLARHTYPGEESGCAIPSHQKPPTKTAFFRSGCFLCGSGLRVFAASIYSFDAGNVQNFPILGNEAFDPIRPKTAWPVSAVAKSIGVKFAIFLFEFFESDFASSERSSGVFVLHRAASVWFDNEFFGHV